MAKGDLLQVLQGLEGQAGNEPQTNFKPGMGNGMRGTGQGMGGPLGGGLQDNPMARLMAPRNTGGYGMAGPSMSAGRPFQPGYAGPSQAPMKNPMFMTDTFMGQSNGGLKSPNMGSDILGIGSGGGSVGNGGGNNFFRPQPPPGNNFFRPQNPSMQPQQPMTPPSQPPNMQQQQPKMVQGNFGSGGSFYRPV